MANKGFSPKRQNLPDNVIGTPNQIRQGRCIETLHHRRTKHVCMSGPSTGAGKIFWGVSHADFGTDGQGLRRASVIFDMTPNFLPTGAA